MKKNEKLKTIIDLAGSSSYNEIVDLLGNVINQDNGPSAPVNLIAGGGIHCRVFCHRDPKGIMQCVYYCWNEKDMKLLQQGGMTIGQT